MAQQQMQDRMRPLLFDSGLRRIRDPGSARRGQAEEEGGGGKGMAATVFWNAGRAAMASHQALTWGRAATSPALGVLLR
uniref:Uncharacterized protein n=1 Tax=Zea mays TaxID=4577 RepID=C4J297_MAIZE|nr:unknown [Zea mays]